MRRILYILFIICMMGCTNDLIEVQTAVPEGEPVEMLLSFGSKGNIETIVSRQTMPLISDEAKVWNLYVFIFDSNGNKIYGHYFNADNLGTKDNLSADTWHVDNEYNTGTVNVKTVSKTGCKIYAIANVDSEMINLSPETFGMVQKESDLLNRVVSLNQQLVERSGFFPMTGVLENVNTGALSGTLELTRLDAKVRFWVQTGASSGIQSFELKNWQIFNASTSTYLMSREVREANNLPATDAQGGYFNTPTKNVEDEEVISAGRSKYGFSFYLLENNLSPKKTLDSYDDRERQVKDADGLNGAWEYANDNSTYVVITGRLIMETDYQIDENTTKEGTTLNADVRYVVHLGDFGTGNYNDFGTLRNHSYTYTVTVNGVNDIRVEVESSQEGQEFKENAPGATGEVTIALQEIFDCDAHYTTHVMTFDQKYIKPDDITWYVRTPFGEGKPVTMNGVDVTTGLDFKWVEFRVNERWNNIYSDNRQLYIPHHTKTDKNGQPYESSDGKTMYVDELVAKLRKGEIAYDSNGKLKVTAFINENYYEEHPTDKDADKNQLWKEVVNQDEMRLMHILTDTKESLDKESKVIGSSYTIQQRSIQTIYNQHHPDLTSAWGAEHFDEYAGLTYNSVSYNGTSENRGNTNDYNGRLNTLKELGLVNANNQFIAGKRWNEYLNTTATNTDSELLGSRNYLRYSCLTRNRDNDGDGLIDADEIRWYMASIKQLVGLWMGADGIQNTACLYQRTAAQKASNESKIWRQHVVSSTATGNSNNPQLIWAEEGSSTGDLQGSYDWGGNMTTWETRMVRNLGMDEETVLTVTPTDYIQINGTDAVPLFDLSYMNEKSIRYLGQEGIDLVYSDEHSAQNRLYWQFEATSVNCPSFNAITFPDMQAELDMSLGNNRFCPEGYRLPNQRELGIMHLYCKSSFWNDVSQSYSRTYYSYGSNGKDGIKKGSEDAKTGWSRDGSNIYMENSTTNSSQKTTKLRCVRDVAR